LALPGLLSAKTSLSAQATPAMALLDDDASACEAMSQ
jgi:hypothetical protein